MARDVFHRFDSLGEFMARAEQVPYDSMWAGTDRVGGVPSFADAVRMARHGWSDVRPQVDAMTDSIVGDIRDTIISSPRVVYDQVGIHPDMEAVFAGDPDFMMRLAFDHVAGSDQVVRLLVDTGANSLTSGEAMLKRAASISALVDVLAMANRQVDLFITSPVTFTSRSQRVHNMIVHLHHAGDPLDVDSLMFALGHPAFHRYLWFSHRHQDGVNSGMGSSIDVTPQLAEDVGCDLVVRREQHRARGCPSAVSDQAGWVRWHLTQLEVIA
jgi:hypothetical protein